MLLFFCPRTRLKTFMQCFALYFLCSKAKHCRNVLGRVLGRKNELHALSLNHVDVTLKPQFLIKSDYITLYLVPLPP